jgi:hypothetical protein
MDQRDFKKANLYLEEIGHLEEGKIIQRELRCLEKNAGKEQQLLDWV